MEHNELLNLQEWSLLSDLLNKLPTKIQKGFFYQDLSLTSIDSCAEFLILGTDTGILFWYNRKSGVLQRLRCETLSSISCVKIVSSVEFMVAAGCISGQVNVFQIQKEHPPNLNLDPLTKLKPIERYTIRDLHHSPVTCVEWSKNGMKLFSGDKEGIIVLTEFDYQMHISKSIEILNEAYDIVQIKFSQPWLLISSIYRAIICEKESNGKWKVSQIGKKDRKILSDFGAGFKGSARNPSIICCRPGFRYWIADTYGNVSQTLLFKDAIIKTSREIPLLNPGRNHPINIPINFGKVLIYKDKYILTWCQKILYILNIEKLTIEATVKRLRGIIDVSICDSEIFILEGPRSIIRISTTPDVINLTPNQMVFDSILPIVNSSQSHSNITQIPIEIEVDEEAVINAEECFELPPIEEVSLNIPIEHSNLTAQSIQEKILIDHSKKLKAFEKLNSLKFEESILFKSGINKKNSEHKKKKKAIKNVEGIVEIGQQVVVEEEDNKNISKTEIDDDLPKTTTTIPCLLNVSFCEMSGYVPDLRSPETLKKDIETKEKLLAETLNIEPVDLSKFINNSTSLTTPDNILPTSWNYPVNDYYDEIFSHTKPLNKFNLINVDDNDLSPTDDEKLNDMNNLCDDIKNVMIRSDISGYKTLDNNIANIPSTSKSFYMEKTPDLVPDLKKVPDYMNIPNLWNVKIERFDNNIVTTNDTQSDNDTSDWEIVEA